MLHTKRMNRVTDNIVLLLNALDECDHFIKEKNSKSFVKKLDEEILLVK